MPTILLVEDNALNCDMLSRRLSRRGYTVIAAANGLQGLAMAGSDAPELILMDVGLPDMDGWEVTQRLKADAATNHIPIIALTAHALVTDREKARQVGCDDYDTKPVEFARLLQKIEHLLVGKGTT